MKITVIGCGRWGSFITWYLDKIGHDVTLYGRSSSKHMQQFLETRSNDLLTLPESVKLVTDLKNINDSDAIVISINSQGLRNLMNELASYNLKNKIFVLCMKGIEIETGKRLSEIVTENTNESNKVAVWLEIGRASCRERV